MGSKKQNWRKLGMIYKPEGDRDWMLTHAGLPVVEPLGGDLFRAYFSGRDAKGKSSVGYFEFDIREPKQTLRVSEKPLLTLGERGTFDDSGISVACVVTHANKRYLYYLGWHLSVTIPFNNTIGLAIDEKMNLDFKRWSQAPVVDRNQLDPLCLSYPWVIVENGVWRMWYGSHIRWGEKHGEMYHHFKHATSKDGIHWERDDKIAVPLKPGEQALSRPMVLKEDGVYKMWYSYRDEIYRIGYAESRDGLKFERMDELAGIDVTPGDWDGESVEYPCVFNQKGKKYMLYNGDKYGKTGMGLAVLEE